ncbi:hypothetical protein ACFSTD_15995 [Novosphingobium colocasiae]
MTACCCSSTGWPAIRSSRKKRLHERLDDPLKRWKLSPIDLAAREQYGAYTKAREAMLEATHTRHAPWTLVDFNDQRLGRLTLISRPARSPARYPRRSARAGDEAAGRKSRRKRSSALLRRSSRFRCPDRRVRLDFATPLKHGPQP